jgi:hypothetical protein
MRAAASTSESEVDGGRGHCRLLLPHPNTRHLERVMGAEVLERRFAAIGARVKLTRASRGGDGRIDIRADGRGEFFEFQLARGVSFNVVEADRDDRCLLLLMRDGTNRCHEVAAERTSSSSRPARQ